MHAFLVHPGSLCVTSEAEIAVQATVQASPRHTTPSHQDTQGLIATCTPAIPLGMRNLNDASPQQTHSPTLSRHRPRSITCWMHGIAGSARKLPIYFR